MEANGTKIAILASLAEPKGRELKDFSKEHEIAILQYQLTGPADEWVLSPSDRHYNRLATEAIADQVEPQLRALLKTLSE